MHSATTFELPQNIIGVIITGIFGIIIGIVAGLMARRGAKLGARENRAPDVQEMWAQQESDRRARQIIEDMYWDLRAAFQSYLRRVTDLIHASPLSDENKKKFELTPAEKKVVNAKLPTDGK